MRKRLMMALAVGAFVAAMMPGLASAAPGVCEGSVGSAAKEIAKLDGPMSGPNGYAWAHPDGKPVTPGQAMQFFCFEKS